MSWLKNLVKPKITTRRKRDVKANVWVKCTGCGEMLYGKDLKANLYVCAGCGEHHKISVAERLAYLCDAETIEDIKVPVVKADPLKFKDRKAYTDRIKEAKKTSDNLDAYRVVQGSIDGVDTIICVFDFSFMAGSMGTQVGEALVTAAKEAVKREIPLLIAPASGGARMQEGILSLMQMVRSTAAILDVKEAGLPYIVLLTNPTTGGVTASFAMQGDVLIAEPKALVGFAGARVIQQTIGETLPEGFQTAEYLLEHGMIDMVTPREEQAKVISRIFRHLKKTA